MLGSIYDQDLAKSAVFIHILFPVAGVELPIIGEAPGSDERTGKKKPSEIEVIDLEEGEEDSDSLREF